MQAFSSNQRTINNLNTSNSVIEFLIDVGDSFIHPHNADCYIVLSAAFKTPVNESMKTENVKLIDNFFQYLFSQIEIQKHGYTIDKIDFPGITSTALLSCFCSKEWWNFWKNLVGKAW